MSERRNIEAESATVARRRQPPASSDIPLGTHREDSDLSETPRGSVALGPTGLGELADGERYRIRRLIGRGGMGEVHLAQDERVGRSVALKVMRPEDTGFADAKRRFLREARVQGQLEHPAIVPVYDLDRDEHGKLFFVMRRVVGVTLDEVIRGLRANDEALSARFSFRRLLSSFQQVCLALDYAHSRGVVHRDVKPSNLMLGDFGEVYVLDWGIAKIVGVEELQSVTEDLGPGLDETRKGDVLGSIGYMAPEQLRASAVDARSDVYALGAVLFQLLTHEALHRGSTVEERARSTAEGVDARASVRVPHLRIPPELDAICVRATAMEPDDRYPSARALHDAIERFLAGDRDLRLRSELAARHIDTARDAAERIFAGGATVGDRETALREAGRALALAPDNSEAADILARLMLEPPDALPPDLVAETERMRREEASRSSFLGGFALLSFVLPAFGMALLGLRTAGAIAILATPLLMAAAHAFYIAYRRPTRFRLHSFLLSLPICFAIGASAGVLGPLFLTPLFALAFISIVLTVSGLGRWRLGITALTIFCYLVPVVGEAIGIFPRAYVVLGDALAIRPNFVSVTSELVRPAVVAVTLSTFLAVAVVIYRLTQAFSAARRRLQLHAWQMKCVAPSREPGGAIPTPPPAEALPSSPEVPTLTSRREA